VRTTSEVAQRAIAEAALATFCKRGYGLATLEEIGAEVGLTRGAVLHHFHSKAGLLEAVVGPWRSALSQFLMTAPVADPPTAGQRRLLLTGFTDLFFAHRGRLQLLANDISARVQLGLDEEWLMPERLITLLVGANASQLARIKGAAAIGALIQPISSAWIDPENATTRAELIETAATVFQGPPSRVSNTRSTNAAGSSMARLGSLPQAVSQR
jgi:AcrR family transcriptional regulator